MITREQLKRVKELEYDIKTLKGYCGDSEHVQKRIGLVNYYPNKPNKPHLGDASDDDLRNFFINHKDLYNQLNHIFEAIVLAKIVDLEEELYKMIYR